VRRLDLCGAALAACVGLVLTACGGAGKSLRPDLGFVSTRDGDYAIYVMNTDGSRQTRLTEHSERDTSSPKGLFFQVEPAWSPDGRMIAFASKRYGSFDLFVMNADGSHTRRLTSSPQDEAYPSWSPDGRQLVFSRGDQGDLWVMNSDGSSLRRLTHDAASQLEPAWSPDGRWIAYVLKPQGASVQELWLVNPSGTQAHRLTSLISSDTPSWSPDARRIAFSSNNGESRFEIYSVRVDGKELRRLTRSPEDAFEPTWSPEGKAIAFARGGSIVALDSRGDETELTDPKNNDSSPAWNPRPSPDGG